MTRAEMDQLGWNELDILLVSGDAYVDHPSFAMALLGRTLLAHGFRVGIVTQPRWTDPGDVGVMGRPRLFAGVGAGALDSMLAHYTAFRKKRSDDAYTPGGKAGARPNRASIVYTNLLRQTFPGLTVVLGGIEASLRRISHYDFWSDSLRRPILLDAKADVLVYGMGERAVVDIAQRARQGLPLTCIPGTTWVGSAEELSCRELPSHKEMLGDRTRLMAATLLLERHVHEGSGVLRQDIDGRCVLVAPPARALTTSEMDALYALPFSRRAHPRYVDPIPAEAMIRDSVTSHRGCGGGCSFCTLALHQGRRIASRSRASIVDEVRRLAKRPEFGGSISDVGGPSANMWGGVCSRPDKACLRASCLTPSICPFFRVDQRAHVDMLRSVRAVPGVRHVRVASGIRFDLALADQRALSGYLREFVGGQLKIAPEHVCDTVLRLMRKPGVAVFEEFLAVFAGESRQTGKEQYVIPYLMSAFPGTTDEDMRSMGRWLRRRGWRPRQVQCFIPIPGAVATAMYYGRISPDGAPLAVAYSDAERLRQHRLLVPEIRPASPPARGSRSSSNREQSVRTGRPAQDSSSVRTAREKTRGDSPSGTQGAGRKRKASGREHARGR